MAGRNDAGTRSSACDDILVLGREDHIRAIQVPRWRVLPSAALAPQVSGLTVLALGESAAKIARSGAHLEAMRSRLNEQHHVVGVHVIRTTLRFERIFLAESTLAMPLLAIADALKTGRCGRSTIPTLLIPQPHCPPRGRPSSPKRVLIL